MKQFEAIPVTKKNVLKFAVPALIGLVLFLCPMSIGERTGMLVGIILSAVGDALIDYTPYVATALMAVTALLTLLCVAIKPAFLDKYPKIKKILMPGLFESVLRILGAATAVLVLFQLGTEVIYSGDTGGTMIELVANIMVWFIVASFFVPFLLDFGLMEFVGTLCSGIARPLLRIPGRSMIDVLTSFVGDQNLGVMVTADQYEKGYYTGKEAVIIATCFSATGIAYWYIISTILEVEAYFIPLVVTMFVTGFLSTMIMCRVWPISAIGNDYYNGVKNSQEDDCPAGMNKFQFALQLAMQKAASFKGGKSMLKRSIDFASSVVFSVLPVVMVIGTLGLIIATYTPVFEWLSLPFKYYLQLLQIPEAAAAAPATVAGFADMLIPALISGGIASVRTRFIICVLSLIQIIYMSEVGPIMLMSKLPIKFWHLLVLFIEKTIVALPIITLMSVIFQIPV